MKYIYDRQRLQPTTQNRYASRVEVIEVGSFPRKTKEYMFQNNLMDWIMNNQLPHIIFILCFPINTCYITSLTSGINIVFSPIIYVYFQMMPCHLSHRNYNCAPEVPLILSGPHKSLSVTILTKVLANIQIKFGFIASCCSLMVGGLHLNTQTFNSTCHMQRAQLYFDICFQCVLLYGGFKLN